MRLAALPGVRDGHTGIFPSTRATRAAPRLSAAALRLPRRAVRRRPRRRRRELVGKRLTAIAGTSDRRGRRARAAARAARQRVEPPRGCSPSTPSARRSCTASGSPRAERFGFDGRRRSAVLQPIPAPRGPRSLGNASRAAADGRAARSGCRPRSTQCDDDRPRTRRLSRLPARRPADRRARRTGSPRLAARPGRAARGRRRPAQRRRQQPRPTGRCSTSCAPRPSAARRVVLLRPVDVLRRRPTSSRTSTGTRERGCVGEPSGRRAQPSGATRTGRRAAAAGLTVHIATRVLGLRPCRRQAPRRRADVPVEPTAADFFAGRDPVLERAVALP